jgi:hypothetical protein
MQPRDWTTRVPCVSAIHIHIQPHPVLPLQSEGNSFQIDSAAEPSSNCGQSVPAEPWQFVENIKKSTVGYVPNSSTWQPPASKAEHIHTSYAILKYAGMNFSQ